MRICKTSNHTTVIITNDMQRVQLHNDVWKIDTMYELMDQILFYDIVKMKKKTLIQIIQY